MIHSPSLFDLCHSFTTLVSRFYAYECWRVFMVNSYSSLECDVYDWINATAGLVQPCLLNISFRAVAFCPQVL